jgi:hypothetical protein
MPSLGTRQTGQEALGFAPFDVVEDPDVERGELLERQRWLKRIKATEDWATLEPTPDHEAVAGQALETRHDLGRGEAARPFGRADKALSMP